MKFYFICLLMILIGCSSSANKNQLKPTGSHLIGGTFEMEDQFGKTVTEKNLVGQYSLVFFGFTKCPTVCPMGLSTIGRVLAKLPKVKSSQIQPIFVTVDPERDTHEGNKNYVKSFHKRFIALRGSLKNTENMVRKYRGYYTKVEVDGDDYLMDHSDIIYLMDKNGKYLAHYSSATSVVDIVKNIEQRIK